MSRHVFSIILKPAGIALMLAVVLAGCERHEAQRIPDPPVDELTVFKTAYCGCCQRWIEYLQEHDFKVTTKEVDNLRPVKERMGVEPQYQSCHTAVSSGGDYVFEGHIPADIIRRFLEGPPEAAIGLAVPGMPAGSPGMETEGPTQPYEVLLLRRDGTTSVYAIVDPSSKSGG